MTAGGRFNVVGRDGVSLFIRLAKTRLPGREIAQWPPPLGHIQVKVILMRVVGLRTEDRAEDLAGAIVDVAKEGGAFVARAPSAGQSDVLALRRDEFGHVERVPISVLAEALRGVVIARSAIVA